MAVPRPETPEVQHVLDRWPRERAQLTALPFARSRPGPSLWGPPARGLAPDCRDTCVRTLGSRGDSAQVQDTRSEAWLHSGLHHWLECDLCINDVTAPNPSVCR